MKNMKFDLHVHSCHSIDSTAEFEKIYAAAKRRGLSGIAICDHNTFTVPPACDDLLIIPACEYSTTAGHMLTFFLKEPLEASLRKNATGRFDWREIVDAAHAQGAIVFLAHPYAPKVERDREVWQAVDGIEVFNARIEHSRIRNANRDAQSTCILLDKPFSAGGDAHFPGELGKTYWECDVEPTLSAVKMALLSKSGRVFGETASPFYRFKSQCIKSCKLKQYHLIPKHTIHFVYSFIRSLRRRPTGYINMEGVKKT